MVIKQFDVLLLQRRGGRAPLVVSLQSDRIMGAKTTLVAPLLPVSEVPKPFPCNPILDFDGARYAVAVEQLGMIRVDQIDRVLGSARFGDYALKRAIDFVFFGN